LPRYGTTPRTTSTMPFEFGDVVLVRFPFTSQIAAKQRPAVVVSNRSYNETRPDVVAMAITTNLEPGEVLVADWQAAGLLRPSAFKPIFATFEKARIVRQLGAVADGDRATLRKLIHGVLG
jgi:mRNA interferase MazF